MEDKINDEKIMDEEDKMGSVDTASTILGTTQESLQISVDMTSKQSAEDIYEQQKQYVFGNAASDPLMESKELDPSRTKSYKEELGLTITVDEDEEDPDS